MIGGVGLGFECLGFLRLGAAYPSFGFGPLGVFLDFRFWPIRCLDLTCFIKFFYWMLDVQL